MTANRNRIVFASALMIFLLPLICSAQQTASLTLETLQATFQGKQAEIDAAIVKASSDALNAYGAAIETTRKVRKNAGDLASVLALDEELKRFAADRTIPTTDKAPAAMAGAVATYHKTIANADAAKTNLLVGLLNGYVKSLDSIVKRLTQLDKLEEAKVAKAEQDRAELLLANTEAKVPKSVMTPSDRGSSRLSGPQPDSTNGCLLWYSFDKSKDSTVMDSSGTGTDGKLKKAFLVGRTKGGPSTECEFNDGSSLDSQVRSHTVSAFTALTLTAWVKPKSKDGIQEIVGRTDGGTAFQTPGGFGLALGQDGTPLLHFNDGQDRRIPFNTVINVGQLTYLSAVLTADGTAIGYIDGKPIQLGSGYSTIPPLPNAFFRMGRWDNGKWSFHFTGRMDEVRVYRRALSAEDIRQLYNSEKNLH